MTETLEETPSNTRLYRKIYQRFGEGEKPLWIGYAGSTFSPRIYNFTLLYVVLSIFPSLMFCFVLRSWMQVPEFIYFVPAVAVPSMVAGASVLDLVMRKNTIYAMTNKRAIFYCDWPKVWTLEVAFDNCPAITRVVHANGQGTVSFAGRHNMFLFKHLGAEAFLINPWLLKEPVFFDVQNVEEVFAQAERLSVQSGSEAVPPRSKVVPADQFFGSWLAVSFFPLMIIGQIIGCIGIMGMRNDGF